MAETSLGEGIGLQQGANRDDFWAKQIYARGVERKAKREKEDEDLIKTTDFNRDFSKTLPYFSNKMVALQKNYANEVAKARQNNKNTARSVTSDLYYQTQLKLSELEQNNARAIASIADKNATIPPEYLKIMTSPNTTDEEWASMHDGQFFMTDSNGTFAYRAYQEPNLDSEIKYGGYDRKNYPTGNHEVLGNQRWEEVKSSYDDDAVKAEALQLAKNNKTALKAAWDTRLWKPEPNEDQATFMKRKIDYANNLAYEVALRNKPQDIYEKVKSTIPQPPAADKKDEKFKPTIVPFDQKKIEKNDSGITTQKESYTRMANMKPAKNVTIPVTDELIAINPELKDVDAISVTVNNLVEGYSPKGKKEWYGVGIQSDYDEPPEEGSMEARMNLIKGKTPSNKKRSSYNPKIPLVLIKSALEMAGNDLSEFESQQVEEVKPTSKPVTKQIKSSDISTKAKAAGYSEKEYRDLLIKNGVKIID